MSPFRFIQFGRSSSSFLYVFGASLLAVTTVVGVRCCRRPAVSDRSPILGDSIVAILCSFFFLGHKKAYCHSVQTADPTKASRGRGYNAEKLASRRSRYIYCKKKNGTTCQMQHGLTAELINSVFSVHLRNEAIRFGISCRARTDVYYNVCTAAPLKRIRTLNPSAIVEHAVGFIFSQPVVKRCL